MNRNNRNRGLGRIALMAVACLAGGAIARADGDVEGPWTLGHGDLSVTYSGSGSTLGFEVHLHTGAVVSGTALTEDEHGEPDAIQIVVPGAANLKRINDPTGYFEGAFDGYDFTGANFNITGAAEDGNLWVLGGSADSSHYGTPFVGLSAEELLPVDWTGNISLVLQSVSFDGSEYGTTGGILSFFTEGLDPRWSSQGGFTQIPISLIPGAGHDHGIFFFSQPGIYEMTLLAEGVHAVNGPVSGSATFQFQVVPEPSSVLLAGGGIAAAGLGALRRRRRACPGGSAENSAG